MSERAADAHVPRGANDVDYGWRAGSAALPRAARAIENVSASSLVTLRAVVLSERERARTARATASAGTSGHAREGALARPRLASGGRVEAKKNRGVEARAAADGDGARTGRADASDVRTALERKAAVYERLSRGEVVDDGSNVDEHAVDFDAKARERDADADADAWARPGAGLMSDDMRRELERREWERGIDAEEIEAERAAAARRVVFDIERETERERDAREDAKRRRDEESEKRREKLKAKFLKSKLNGVKK